MIYALAFALFLWPIIMFLFEAIVDQFTDWRDKRRYGVYYPTDRQ